MTGCLRISKESIFTGLNNFEVLSILNVQYDECFGFTDTEVKKILSDYNLSDHYLQIREWYDGYRFGNTDIYCPWDVIRYCKSLCTYPYIQESFRKDILLWMEQCKKSKDQKINIRSNKNSVKINKNLGTILR